MARKITIDSYNISMLPGNHAITWNITIALTVGSVVLQVGKALHIFQNKNFFKSSFYL